MKASAATVNCLGCVMADITLAELNGRVWLVGGEPYIDDLLANTLAPEISIELVPCESKSEVHALWVQHCGQPDDTGRPLDDPSGDCRTHPPHIFELFRFLRRVVGRARQGCPHGYRLRRRLGDGELLRRRSTSLNFLIRLAPRRLPTSLACARS